MSISIARQISGACSCGAPFTRRAWVAIDAVERPDLLGNVIQAECEPSECDVCGAPIHRTEPLLVTRLSKSVPVLLGLSRERLEDGRDPTVGSEALIQDVRQRMGDLVTEVPGPLLATTFGAVALAVDGDLEADMQDIGTACAEIPPRDGNVSDYERLLEGARASESDRRLQLALNRLPSVRSSEELRRLFQEFPELGGSDASKRAEDRWSAPTTSGAPTFLSAVLRMLDGAAAGDFESAWTDFERSVDELMHDEFDAEVESLLNIFGEAVDHRDAVATREVGDRLLEIARSLYAEHLELMVLPGLGAAYVALPGPGLMDRLETGIALLARALDLMSKGIELPDAEANAAVRVELLTNLGAAYGARPLGDPSANQERAIELFRAVLEIVSIESDGHSWSMAQTNLALCLLNRASARMETAQPDPASSEFNLARAEIEESIDRLNAALQWRSFDRDPEDWAYTQGNLGIAYGRVPTGDREENLVRSIEHFAEASRGFAASHHRFHHAQALHNLSSSKLQLAQFKAGAERVDIIRDAARDAEASLSERTLDEAPIEAGLTWQRLARCSQALGDTEEAIAALRQALVGLASEVAPGHAREAARDLGEIASDARDWPLAAEAWELAAIAADLAWERRVTPVGRAGEVQSYLNIFRWAGFALAKVGRLERAVEVLELGRARQIGMWLQTDRADLETVWELDPDLARRFLDLQASRRTFEGESSFGPSEVSTAVEIAAQLSATVQEIRALPGLEFFLERPRVDEVVASVQEGDALVYVLTAPAGSIALIVGSGVGDRGVQLVETAAVTSTEMLSRFMTLSDDGRELVGGYLHAHAIGGDELSDALNRFGEPLGNELLRKIADSLSEAHVTTVWLVPFSLLGLLPLHALTWGNDQGAECLLDRFDVLFTPSATVRSVCVARSARTPIEKRAVVVGNPLPQSQPLDGAELEAEMVAQALSADDDDVLISQVPGRGVTRRHGRLLRPR